MYIINDKYLVNLDKEKYIDVKNLDCYINEESEKNEENEENKKNFYDRWIEITRVKTQILYLGLPNTDKKIKKLFKILEKYLKKGTKKTGIITLKEYNIQLLYFFNNYKNNLCGIWVRKIKN